MWSIKTGVGIETELLKMQSKREIKEEEREQVNHHQHGVEMRRKKVEHT